MKRAQGISLLSIWLVLSACSTTETLDNKSLDTLAPVSEMTIDSSKIQVSELITTSYDTEECYNITPDFVADNSDFLVLKYSDSTESFILYDDTAYSIGTCFGGYGITSMALADLNTDGQYELYYTFSWGSGMHRSQVGYFDPACKKVTIFDDSFFGADVMLTMNDVGDLCVNKAVLDMDSFVDFTIKAQELIGTIAFKKNEITLNID